MEEDEQNIWVLREDVKKLGSQEQKQESEKCDKSKKECEDSHKKSTESIRHWWWKKDYSFKGIGRKK